MKRQLTIRYDRDLEQEIDALSERETISRNQAVMRLLRKGAGLDRPAGDRRSIGDALDRHVGTWSDEDVDELHDAIASLGRVDADLWR